MSDFAGRLTPAQAETLCDLFPRLKMSAEAERAYNLAIEAIGADLPGKARK